MPNRPYLPFGKPNLSDEEVEAVTRTIRSGWIGMGPETIAFEEELTKAVGGTPMVTVSSCTAALFLALVAAGVQAGDEVICPSLTWCSTVNAVIYLGATPVLCDVDPTTFSVTPAAVLAKLTSRTRAVLAVHMAGLAVDVGALRSALPEQVTLVEDAAHAMGSTYLNGRPVGSSGNLTCFSFYANKNLSTGEGGAIATPDGDMVGRLKSLRMHGLASDAWNRFVDPRSAFRLDIKELGYKYNYTDLQASIGRVQLRRQPEFAATRLAIAQHYAQALPKIHAGIQSQVGLTEPGHARHLYQILLPEGLSLSRDEVVLKMRNEGFGASIHYTPLHWMTYYKGFAENLTETDRLAPRLLTLPIGAAMTVEDADRVMLAFDKTLKT